MALAPLMAAVLFAAPLHAQEWRDFNEPYMRSVVGLLKRLKTTQAHWGFISREGIGLVVTDNPSHVSDSVAGAYDLVERRMFLDEVRLLDAAEALQDAGATAATTAEVLAWKTLPTIVHEMTHAMVHDRVRRLAGTDIAFPCVEDEMLAFYDGAITLFELFDEKPRLWEKDRILDIDRLWGLTLKAWLKGAGGLDEVIRDTYSERPSLLEESHETLLAYVDRRIDVLKEGLAAARGARRAADQCGPAMSGIARRTYADLQQAVPYMSKELEIQLNTRVFLSDEEALARLRSLYSGALKERRARLEASRRRVR